MTSWLLLLMLLMVVSHAQASVNMSSWDALEAVVNGIPFDVGLVRRKEAYASYLWNAYKRSTRLQRFRIANEISESLKEIAFRDTRLDMIGVILFGPEKGRSILRAGGGGDGYEKKHVGEDYTQCLINTDDLFTRHCGPRNSIGSRHIHSISNICHYVDEMVMIEDAILATCGSNNLAPYVVDVENPTIDVAPAPIHGSSVYCGCVYVNGISRMNLQSYAQTYKLAFESLPHTLHHKIQVCFHQNASLGLCQCEKDSWRHIQTWSSDSFTSPFEKRFIDVKFANAAFGYVTVSLVKVPLLQLLHYVFLVLGAGLLSISSRSWVLDD
ncbi:uncharacterized protein LOC143555533 [Bidens hawaiensis]|uniref:uncharacterized protein LOC143555533 n=1 Tax=Bidens hawaiensis TaxID=980011 RepID=UPI00404A5316